MDGFFPEKFLDEILSDEPLPCASESTSIPDMELSTGIEFEQESFDLGLPSFQNLIEEALPPSNQSAFFQCTNIPRIGFGHESSQNLSISQNLNERNSCQIQRTETEEYERERATGHVINERMRRYRQRQCCIALHSMLPQGTKTDNNSVILMAMKEINRLQSCREELQRENFELEGSLQALVERKRVGGTKIQFKIPRSASGIDSMVEILKCLKILGVNTKSIKANFSSEELFAVLETETQIADKEVERAIERTLRRLSGSCNPNS
ncbi:hypothetical protein L6164_012851 [Bauhinia variegata]|uniref:Uncharacterized protein n=1 Tax=Bauhinia variegata TaxID=167791 RepID=A0ACB9PCW7_BAUVA|nr:hypothetical protein L6164_012851 [Bauhinia variegata]